MKQTKKNDDLDSQSNTFWTDDRIETLRALSNNQAMRTDNNSGRVRRYIIDPEVSESEQTISDGKSATALEAIEYDPDEHSPTSERVTRSFETRQPLAIHLSIHTLERLMQDLVPFYGVACPITIVLDQPRHRERIIRGTIATIEALTARAPDTYSMFVLVG